ncbi:MAG TPA: hypothetical protein VKB19_03900 [Pedobacter sp.]|nr:hypothetical protein [Pedobacter sp.]
MKQDRLKNSVWTGLSIGVTVPGILLVGAWYLMHRYAFLAKADLLLVCCISVNALLMHHFFKQDRDQLGKGIISATFLWALLFFFYKMNQ